MNEQKQQENIFWQVNDFFTKGTLEENKDSKTQFGVKFQQDISNVFLAFSQTGNMSGLVDSYKKCKRAIPQKPKNLSEYVNSILHDTFITHVAKTFNSTTNQNKLDEADDIFQNAKLSVTPNDTNLLQEAYARKAQRFVLVKNPDDDSRPNPLGMVSSTWFVKTELKNEGSEVKAEGKVTEKQQLLQK